jgi:hypothetical protein
VTGKKALGTGRPSSAKLLAYVEWFSRPKDTPDDTTEMYKVDRARDKDKKAQGDIIELESIVQHRPLVPQFPAKAEQVQVTEDTCLDDWDKFWINCFHDQSTYQSVY